METIEFPRRVHVGDTIGKTVTLPKHPASDGWALNIVVTNADLRYTITTSASGDNHVIDQATDAWTDGAYQWVAFATKDGKRERVSSGDLQVLPDIVGDAADLRSHAEKVLASLESVLEGKATTDDYSTNIRGKQLTRYTYEELLKLRNTYRAEVRAERRARSMRQGKHGANQIRVRFP